MREYEYMLGQDLRELYIDLLTRKEAPVKMCCQVLCNMLMYLMEEEVRMIKADQECKFISVIPSLLYDLTYFARKVCRRVLIDKLLLQSKLNHTINHS